MEASGPRGRLITLCAVHDMDGKFLISVSEVATASVTWQNCSNLDLLQGAQFYLMDTFLHNIYPIFLITCEPP